LLRWLTNGFVQTPRAKPQASQRGVSQRLPVARRRPEARAERGRASGRVSSDEGPNDAAKRRRRGKLSPETASLRSVQCNVQAACPTTATHPIHPTHAHRRPDNNGGDARARFTAAGHGRRGGGKRSICACSRATMHHARRGKDVRACVRLQSPELEMGPAGCCGRLTRIAVPPPSNTP